MMASKEGVMTLAGEMTRHDMKPAGMADPSIGNHLAMTTARIATTTRIRITLHATPMTKGRAPTAMTMIQLHEEQREAIAVAEIHRRTPRVKGMILHHPHQAAPMAVAVAVAGPCPWWWGCLLAPFHLLFGSLEASVNFWMFGFCFVQFREYFMCNFSKTQK
jgi:hypothetical protein